MIDIFILEDTPGHIKILRDVLHDVFEEDFNITEARSLKEARGYLQDINLKIDIALIDVELPDGSGIDFLKETKRINAQSQCVIVTLYEDKYLLEGLRAGMEGYLIKELSKENMSKTLRKILDGDPPLSPKIARQILGYCKATVDLHASHDTKRSEKPVDLTEREEEILKSIGRGFSESEIAEALKIAPSTVKSHKKNMYKKLEISTLGQAGAEARRRGLV